jgi:hypothetical protein
MAQLISKLMSKLKLKELEIISRLSTTTIYKVIRCTINLKTFEITSLNGDWSLVTGYSEKTFEGKDFMTIIPDEYDEVIKKGIHENLKSGRFNSLTTEIITSKGRSKVLWEYTYYEELMEVILIGKVLN